MKRAGINVFLIFSLILGIGVLISYVNMEDTPNSAYAGNTHNVRLVEMEGRIISGFPQFPVYENLKLEYSFLEKVEGQNHYEVVFESDDSFDDILDYYLTQPEREGWLKADYFALLENSKEQTLNYYKENLQMNVIVEQYSGEAVEVIVSIFEL